MYASLYKWHMYVYRLIYFYVLFHAVVIYGLILQRELEGYKRLERNIL